MHQKMQQTCLFCKNTRVFNIHSDFGNNSHTAKDDMIQFFGYQIESHLRPDDAICNLCMNIMDNVAKLKRRLLPHIFRSTLADIEDHKPLNFNKIWGAFASMDFEDDVVDSRSPTPNLLQCKRVVPYEGNAEIKIAEIERQRSLSRVSSAKSDAESEIVKAFATKRRRKRGHNWSRRKNGRYSRTSVDTRKTPATSYSRKSGSRSRPMSSLSILSTESYESFYPPAIATSAPLAIPRTTSLVYLDGCLQNKRTRSVSRKQEEEIDTYYTTDQAAATHICPVEGCSDTFEDIDHLVAHKIKKHQHLALFWCNFCDQKYTTSDELGIHKRTHSEQFACAICQREFYRDRDLLEHWQEHVKKSVPCKFCGKRFVDKNICNKHMKNVHKRNTPSRIDYSGKTSESNDTQSKEFEVRILVQEDNETN